MIIKGATSSTSYLSTVIILLCSIGGILSLWYFLPRLTSWKQKDVIHCDAEITRGKYFIANGDHFFNSQTQNKEEAFQGNYSSKISTGEGFQYGFGIDFNSYEDGATYVASVWRKKEYHEGKGSLIIIDKNNVINIEITEPIKEKNGWELLEQKFTIPFQQDIKDLRIYVRTNGKGIFYFDDLKIIKKEKLVTTHLHNFKKEVLEISISEKGIKKLEQKRKKALQVGILQSDDNDWVNAKIKSSTEDEMPIELRLKGDWLDHLKNNKWSYRIKVKDPFAWNGMKTFSLQSPETREFLNEWILHQWWKKEDVLTPRYDFVELQLNGKSLGVYAYEEHFEKQLPESNQRREGIIVRFSEEGFWADVKTRISDLEGNPNAHINNSAHYSTASVTPFKENQILKNTVLKKQLETAQQLLSSFINQSLPVDQIFEIDKMAKYFAICDLMHAQHSAAWHNMRFYFNPVLNKLEPIGFDGFPTYNYPYLLLSEGALSKHFKEDQEPIQYFFSDTIFLKKYISNLFEFSNEKYVDTFLSELENGSDERKDFITKEFRDFNFDKHAIEKRISGIRSGIFPHNDLTLKAHLQQSSNTQNEILIGNTHSLPVEIIGTGIRNNKVDNYLKNKITLPAYITSPFYKDQSKKQKKAAPALQNIIRYNIEYQQVTAPKSSKYIFYKVMGFEQVFYSKISNWNITSNIVSPPNQNINSINSNNIFTVNENKVIFHKGKKTVTQDIIIPKGYHVYFSEGAELDFIQNSKFLSYSPIKMNGTKDNPVKIFSNDFSINGFNIIQADESSELEFVIFENLNSHRKENWNLTGAVTFYESDVVINDCLFTKNHCEDGLNVIRSNVEINRSLISETKSDGLDFDFCNGSINDCSFSNTTNDGIDISGSNIYIVDCNLDNCGDKGISVGEQSKSTIMNTTIKNSITGIASKDLSEVTVENVLLENCNQGFTIYQKKAEFGGSKMEVKEYTAKKVRQLHNVRVGCTLILKDQEIKK